ncbi:hypothetical protein MIMGU_mgv11b0080701mg, partial [Erythranthe guttata]
MSTTSILLILLSLASLAAAEIRVSEIRSDARPIIPFDEFGFTHRGQLELNITRLSLSGTTPDLPALSKVGFFLCTRDAWLHVLQQIEDAEINCALGSDVVHRVFTFDRLPDLTTADVNFLYAESVADQYTLVFANCLSQLKVSMNVRSAMYNLEDGKSNRRTNSPP